MKLGYILSIFLLLVSTQSMAKNNIIPLRDFFKNPEQTNFQISHTGQYIAYLKPWNNRLNVFVQTLSAKRLPMGEAKQVTFVKDRDIGSYFWKGDNTILYSRDFGGDENYHIFAVNIHNDNEKDMTPFPNTRCSVVDDLSEVSDTDILIQSNQRNSEVFDVYNLNTLTGTLEMVAKNPGNIGYWLTDHKGKVRVAIESDGLLTKIYTRPSADVEFKKIMEFDFKNDFSPLIFSYDNKQLYASSNLGRDKGAIVKVDPNTGKELQLIFEHPEVDVERISSSDKRKVMTAISYYTWKLQYHFLDKIAEQRHAKLSKQLGDVDIMINSRNKDEDLFTVYATSDKIVGRYYLLDEKNDKLTLLYDVAPDLKPEKLATMQPIDFETSDGLRVHGYLTLPNSSSGKNLPVIVNPHGGPWARDVWGYESEVQFLANRGYAVLQLNFRGSTGYGKEFYTKSFKQWGQTMQSDITEGVNWLIARGIADPKRIGIYGASYGGYATLAGITYTPDLYACAVDYVGVSNLLTFLNTIPDYWKPYLIKMQAMVGDPVVDKAMLTAYSPVFHADRIKTPLFVAQGAKDPRVNIDESNQIVDALRKRGVEVEYMVKQDEGHGFRNEENRFEFYEAMEKFLQTHLL